METKIGPLHSDIKSYLKKYLVFYYYLADDSGKKRMKK